MVWLNLAAENGSALYLDIFSMEPRRQNGGLIFAIEGVVGDGGYEGRVLVEAGEQVQVTFVDEWLDAELLREFFRQVDRLEVETALKETVSLMTLDEKVRSITAWTENASFRQHGGERRRETLPPPYRRPREERVRGIGEGAGEWRPV